MQLLIVEDEASLMESMVSYLEMEGFKIHLTSILYPCKENEICTTDEIGILSLKSEGHG